MFHTSKNFLQEVTYNSMQRIPHSQAYTSGIISRTLLLYLNYCKILSYLTEYLKYTFHYTSVHPFSHKSPFILSMWTEYLSRLLLSFHNPFSHLSDLPELWVSTILLLLVHRCLTSLIHVPKSFNSLTCGQHPLFQPLMCSSRLHDLITPLMLRPRGGGKLCQTINQSVKSDNPGDPSQQTSVQVPFLFWVTDNEIHQFPGAKSFFGHPLGFLHLRLSSTETAQ